MIGWNFNLYFRNREECYSPRIIKFVESLSAKSEKGFNRPFSVAYPNSQASSPNTALKLYRPSTHNEDNPSGRVAHLVAVLASHTQGSVL